MRLKLLTLFAPGLILAGCGSTPEESADTTGAGSAVNAPTRSQPEPGPAPGSQEDLLVEVGDRVLFSVDSSTLTPSGRATVESLAAWLKSFPSVTMSLEGHADERGTREYNLALGGRRANSVQDHLIALGVDPSRLSTISYGKERPVVLANTEEAAAQNRRSVFIVN